MRRLANFYIVLFLIDAGLSLIDELLVASSSPLPLFSSVRYTVAYVVIALSMLFFACLGIDRRLPKRVFLPLTLYAPLQSRPHPHPGASGTSTAIPVWLSARPNCGPG